MKSAMKPILFNTNMVERIRSGEKTMTRRLMNPQPEGAHTVLDSDDEARTFDLLCGNGGDGGRFIDWAETVKAPYWPGDILYVRETWRVQSAHRFEADVKIEFRAGGEMTTICFPGGMSQSHGRDEYDRFIEKWGVGGKWHPSIFMPKTAARIFLLVKGIWPEQLQEITEEDAFAEGYKGKAWCEHLVYENYPNSPIPCYAAGNPGCPSDPPCNHSIPELFGTEIWDSTIKPADRDRYGWAANPWVWATEFGRISKEEALKSVRNE